MKEQLIEIIQWWYPRDMDCWHLNGITVSIMAAWLIFIIAIILASWNDEFHFKTRDDVMETFIALGVGFVAFTIAGFAFCIFMPLILPLMFMVGICIITVGAKKLHTIKQEKRNR